MTRRCKAGQRARIIGRGENVGKVVLVVRYYFGEKVSDSTWPRPLFPWVVASLGGPLRNFEIPTGKEAPRKMVIVLDDCELQPLDDEDDGQHQSTETDTPKPVATVVPHNHPSDKVQPSKTDSSPTQALTAALELAKNAENARRLLT